MPPPNPIAEAWTPEPELRDPPPRRTAALEEDYPDLNRPNMLAYAGAGGAMLLVGLILLFVGFGGHHVPLGILGIALLLGGAILFGMYPAKTRSHEERIQHLLTYGVPVIARVLQADNVTGKTYERSLKYQIVLPGGEITHRSVNCDERRLGRAIPCDVTALMDMKTSDAELYCALPMRALPRGEGVSRAPAFTPAYAPAAATTPAYIPTPGNSTSSSVNPQPTTMATVASQTPAVATTATTLGGQFGDTLVPAPAAPSTPLAGVGATDSVDTQTPVVQDGHMQTMTVDARPVRPTVPANETPAVPETPVEEAPKPKKPATTSKQPWE